MVYPFVSGVLDVGICLLSLVRSIAWLKPFVRGFLTTEILFVGVHHLPTIRWSGIVGFAYQFLGVSDQSAGCSCGY